MTLRIVGAVLIVAGCGGAGFLLSTAYRREIASLSALVEMFNYFECELQYNNSPLSDIFASFASNRKDTIGEFCDLLAKEIDTQVCPNAHACILAALEKRKNIPKETALLIKKFGLTLGKFSTNGQILEIRSIRTETKNKLDILLNDQDTKLRNYKTLGICAGAAIVILFI